VYYFKLLPQRFRYLFTCLIIPVFLLSIGANRIQAQGILQVAHLPKTLIAEVIGIQDGDTIELKIMYTGKDAGYRKDKLVRIRFLHINSPERGKPFYKVAKQFTTDKCYRQKVTIQHEGEFDRYGRLLGVVILPNGQNLNKMLVAKGLAVHYKKYSSDQSYAKLEIAAQKKKIGIWSLPANH
tara:strand:+ start:261 stop:806 length:546 start_codon:yes stop_codon:yes gene_type:complete